MQTAKDILTTYYDCFNNQDINGMMQLLDDDVVHDINQGHREIGKEAFLKFLQRMEQCYQETVKNLIIMHNDDQTRAAAEFIIDGYYLQTDTGLPQATKQHYQLQCGSFFEIKNKKISRVTVYYNLENWLKQIIVE